MLTASRLEVSLLISLPRARLPNGRVTMAGNQKAPVHIIFIGAGAVGCFYASRLHYPEHGVHVSLVARSNYAAIQKDGVKMETHSFGDYLFRPHAVFPSADEAAKSASAAGHAWDYVVVTTKALPERGDASALIQPSSAPPPPSSSSRTAAVTVISAEQTAPGIVRQNRWTRISIGPYTDGRGTGDEGTARAGDRAVADIGRWWGDLGSIRDVDPHDEIDLQLVRWHKLCINSAMNPSAVLSGGRGNADMVADAELREHLTGVMDEIRAAVPKILGRPFPDSLATPDRIIRSTERNTGSKPSMLLDWEAGRPMELEVILGNPVRIARERGASLPRMQTLYALLRSAQEARERSKSDGKGRL
ncbi:unnamed protein product [Parascedosporium putredinis]|uniref:2-dehydropantoate 2-reductase n=1 Tax=Parascedosporium putredinis TaxID=1442378 RepID=A0A9P1H2F2_9PEZI|nr:unnamed protein product [Parascedosporium putredinis]CAI7996057.1 unnamed protein product [Parascedosporium putredinis]